MRIRDLTTELLPSLDSPVPLAYDDLAPVPSSWFCLFQSFYVIFESAMAWIIPFINTKMGSNQSSGSWGGSGDFWATFFSQDQPALFSHPHLHR